MDGAALALQCDITDDGAISSALLELVRLFGGLDLLVSNAGSFPASAAIAEMDDARWQHSLVINLSAHMKLLRACAPYLSHGFDPAVVFVGSKNVPAPGPGAAAYSVAKAGLAQLARIAALEWGSKGIRVNTVHPNAVYDTAIWTNEVLASRAAHYGVSVEEYKRSNVLGTELQAADVAETVAALLGSQFDKTTGAQIPVDGGNDRVI
jgi:NAD(P)-dependent dehydrogenase (short-subunit alcohol dehydrogenase family)